MAFFVGASGTHEIETGLVMGLTFIHALSALSLLLGLGISGSSRASLCMTDV
jgi:hypothetical protein